MTDWTDLHSKMGGKRKMQSSVLLYQSFKVVPVILRLEFMLLFIYSRRLRFQRSVWQPGMNS